MILTLNLRPDVTVLAVIVPDDARLHQVDRANNLWFRKPGNDWNKMPLPPGSYELIGLLREVPELTAAKLVKCRTGMEGEVMYWDYRTNEKESGGFKAIDSLRSAITTAGGDPKQNWLIIKKIA